LITSTPQAAYVQRRCDAGEQVEYKTYPSLGASTSSAMTPR
jgi:hypothetical protein